MRSRSGSSIWLERRPVTAEVASSSLVRIAIHYNRYCYYNNKMTTQITLILLNALIIGVILTHLILTTPAVFRALEGESVSKFLRVIFPRYYLLLLLLSFPILVVLYFQDVTSYWWLAVNVSFHAALGFLTIPLTNAAKDRGWDKLFSFTHGLSVYCTIVILILSIIQFFIYVA